MAISKAYIDKLVNDYAEENGLFVVDCKVSTSNSISVLVDSMQGVNIKDCVKLSRHIEQQLDRDTDDFELNVSSPGLSEPLKLPQQYQKNIGRTLEITLNDDKIVKGELKEVTDTGISVAYSEKVKVEGKKKKQTIHKEEFIEFNNILKAKVIISFK